MSMTLVDESPRTPNLRAGADEDDAAWLKLLAPPMTPETLGILGKYEILEVLGRGGFGVVLKATDVTLRRTVAVKLLHPGTAGSVSARTRFLREARAAAAVRHDNVVPIHAIESEPFPYLVMEYIPGESLEHLLERRGRLTAEETVRIGVQIARGLAAAHAQGLVHRDVKPANVLLERGPEPRARLTDFGLARSAEDPHLTSTGVVAGTPAFMAPEQAHGELIDPRTDLFSLGSTLYQMLTGRLPFRGATALATLRSVTEEQPRPVRDFDDSIPQWLSAVVAKLHAKKPADRYQSADALAAALLAGGPAEGGPAHAVPQRKTRRFWLSAAAAVVGVAAAVVAFVAFGPGKSGSETRPNLSGPIATNPPIVPAPALGPDDFAGPAGIAFRRIPMGAVLLGLGGDESDVGNYTVAEDFFLGKYEVTQKQWRDVMGDNPSEFRPDGESAAAVAHLSPEEIDRLPVERVTWNQCQQFVEKLRTMDATPGWTYRLPKSKEWEYACRGGPGQPESAYRFHFYFDRPTNEATPAQLNFDRSQLNRTVPVGSYLPNRLGLYDMHGNVYEYCHETKDDDDGGKSAYFRNGLFIDNPDLCRAARTSLWKTTKTYQGAGLRVARVPAAKGE